MTKHTVLWSSTWEKNKPPQPEASLQAASAKYFALKLPKTFIAIHVPNGAQFAKPWHGKRLLAQGMVAGVPDWLIVGPANGLSTRHLALGVVWAIELKAPGKYLSPVQKAFHKRLEAAGVPVAMCRSLDEIEAQLKQWGIL